MVLGHLTQRLSPFFCSRSSPCVSVLTLSPSLPVSSPWTVSTFFVSSVRIVSRCVSSSWLLCQAACLNLCHCVSCFTLTVPSPCSGCFLPPVSSHLICSCCVPHVFPRPLSHLCVFIVWVSPLFIFGWSVLHGSCVPVFSFSFPSVV